MVNRRTSMVGDALSHSSLPGVAIGLILGWDPVGTAVIVCVIAALKIETIRKKFPEYGDMVTAVVHEFGVGDCSHTHLIHTLEEHSWRVICLEVLLQY